MMKYLKIHYYILIYNKNTPIKLYKFKNPNNKFLILLLIIYNNNTCNNFLLIFKLFLKKLR